MNLIFSPNKSITASVLLEKTSIQYIEALLLNTDANPYLSENDKTPNYDGYIELLDGEFICGKITVQVKTYPDKYKGAGKFDIPTSLLGYSLSVPTEIVLLLVVDSSQEIIYWKHISNEFIYENRSKASQKTITYNFLEQENLSFDNRIDVINLWKQIYDKSAASIIDKKKRIEELIDMYACAFEAVNSHFYSIPDSYIERLELQELIRWIKKDFIVDKNNNICVLTGDAGVGKSVLIKQISNKLRNDGVSIFAIKADMQTITSEDVLSSIYEVINFITANKKERIVLLIDQIDALSLSLSSDRAQINAYFSLLNKFSTPLYSNLRIVVSCRQFDLDYDPILNNLKDKKNIKLDKLKIEDVKAVLLKLVGKDNVEKINDHTIQLLQTAQYLDTYCRIYKISQIVSDFPSQIKIYEELWNLKVLHPTLATVLSSDLETLLFNIAKKIHVEQSLSIKWKPSGVDVKCIDYLLTEGLITSENSQIRFFHQSFYDFVFSRNFMQENISLYSFVLDNHQGFFVRSSIKQALDYLRDNDSENYINQIHLLLEDNNIRFHIKLLVLQFLAFQKPVRGEVALILKLLEANRELFDVFFKQNLPVEWFDNIIGKLQYEIIDIEDFEKNSTLVNYFCSCSKLRDEKVFSIIELCANSDVKKKLALNALWYTDNCNNPLIVKWYSLLYKETNDYKKLFFLENAIVRSPDFVCKELQDMLSDAVKFWSMNQKYPIDNYHLFDTIVTTLVNDQPLVIYPVLKQVILKLIEDTSIIDGDYLSWSIAFNKLFHEHDNVYIKIKNQMISIMKLFVRSHQAFILKEIQCFLLIKNRTSYHIALEVMNESPQLFNGYVYEILKNHDLTEYLLLNTEEGYYFKELLKMSFPFYEPTQVRNLQEYALSFFSKLELESHTNKCDIIEPLYFMYGSAQRALLYSFPNHLLRIDLKHKRDELDRRFKYKYINCNYSKKGWVTSAARGLVSDEEYNKLTVDNWKYSFIKLTDNKRLDYCFSLNVHKDKFKKCVKETPEKYYAFICEMMDDLRIKQMYKIAGIFGLVEANYKIDDIYPMFKKIFGDSSCENIDDVIAIAQLYLLNASIYYREISEMLLKIIRSEFTTNYKAEQEYILDGWNDRSAEFLMKGLNSDQGKALVAFSENLRSENKQQYVFEVLMNESDCLAVELKLVVLYQIQKYEIVEEQLQEELMLEYLPYGVSEFLYLYMNILNKYLYCNPSLVIPYLESVIDLPRAQNGLGVLCFLGACYGIQFCELIIQNRILKLDLNFLDSALVCAFHNLSDITCREYSLSLINSLNMTNDKVVSELFSDKLSDLPSSEFICIMPILDRCMYASVLSQIGGLNSFLKTCCVGI